MVEYDLTSTIETHAMQYGLLSALLKFRQAIDGAVYSKRPFAHDIETDFLSELNAFCNRFIDRNRVTDGYPLTMGK